MTLCNGPHKKGNEELRLYKLDSPRIRADRKKATYLVELIWRNPATGGVLGDDYGLFTAAEAKPMLTAADLFEMVTLQ